MASPIEHKEELALQALLREYGHTEEGPPVPSGTFEELMRPIHHFFDHIHYTWLTKPIESFPKELIPLALKALPEHVCEPLSKLIGITPSGDLSPPIRAFFAHRMAESLGISPLVPIDFLPPSPCKRLTDLDKRELITLAAHLGLYDLAASLKQTLDAKPLQKVEAMLTKPEREALDSMMRAGDPLEEKPLPLNAWGTNAKELLQQLQLQGLKRMGLAMAHDERSLVWHISHRLDQGRGQYVIQAAKQSIDRNISRLLGAQIERRLQEKK